MMIGRNTGRYIDYGLCMIGSVCNDTMYIDDKVMHLAFHVIMTGYHRVES